MDRNDAPRPKTIINFKFSGTNEKLVKLEAAVVVVGGNMYIGDHKTYSVAGWMRSYVYCSTWRSTKYITYMSFRISFKYLANQVFIIKAEENLQSNSIGVLHARSLRAL